MSQLTRQFDALFAYSPLHNVKGDKPYPSTLLVTADHDDRVVPLHTFKYCAEIQYALGSQDFQDKPLLARIEVKAGHGAGKPLSKVIAEHADILAYIAWSLQVELK
jgi:prolyl oligopeptidase